MRYYIFNYSDECYDCDTEEEMKKYLVENISSNDDAKNYTVIIGERFDVERTFSGKKLAVSSDPYIKIQYRLIHLPTGEIRAVGNSAEYLIEELPTDEAKNYTIEEIKIKVLAEVDDNPTIRLVKSNE